MKRAKVSNNVIRRLPRYLRRLDELTEEGVSRISSFELANQLGLTASQIRQDFSCFGEFGQQGYGYNVPALRAHLASVLGVDRGFTAVLIEMAIGLPIGIIAGYFGGWVDTILMRILEVINSIPTFLIIIIIAAGLERSIWNVIWVMGVFYWPSFVRLIRAYFLSLKQQDFIQAAKALGIKPLAIIIRHMLPAVAMPILIQASSAVVGAVFAESSLSYLGFGIMEPTPTWGAMLSKSTQYLRFVPTMALFPGLLITLVTLSMNFIADGLRDAFDPRSRS